MARITFIEPFGRRTVEAPLGVSLMTAARTNDVDGIIADCGGSLNCATCHVMIEERYLGLLDPTTETESDMLDLTAAPRMPNSRLSCQVIVREELDGMTVTVAEPQI